MTFDPEFRGLAVVLALALTLVMIFGLILGAFCWWIDRDRTPPEN